MNKNKIIKLIKSFEKEHKKIFDDSGGDTDCNIVDNEIHRIASKKEWGGTEEEWKTAKKEQVEMDKCVRCYTCEFIKELRRLI